MDKKLFLAIEEAEQRRDDSIDISNAICKLSQHKIAIPVLICAYQEAVIDAELKWREIKQRDDFKALYHDREQAYTDFLRECFAKH